MLSKSRCAVVLAFSLCFGVVARTASAVPFLVYSNDFATPGSIGLEWSGATWHDAHTIPEVSAHIGDYSLSQSTTLTLTGLPAHSTLALQFDLYLFDTWDGENLTFGKDFFSLSGDVAFSATFTNHQSEGQSYPGVADVNPGLPGTTVTQIYFGLDPSGTGDEFLIGHSAGVFSVTFGGPTTQTDESWAIDNVRVFVDTPVSLVPEPATLGLVCIGLTAMLLRRRKG